MTAKKVLYAEDEFTNRKLIEIRLKGIGLKCDLAQDGVTALEMSRRDAYDLIILDQYMPGMNGDAVAREIRKNDKDVPLIAITSDDGEIEKLKSAGFNEIFIKPLRGTSYLQVIQSYLDQ